MEVSTFIPKLQYSYIIVLIEDVQFSLVHSQYSLRGICLSGGNYFRGRFIVSDLQGNFPVEGGGVVFLGGNCSGGTYSSREIVRGGNFSRKQLSGVQISSGTIVRTPCGKLSGGQLSGHLILDLCGISSIAMLLWR